jgi:hypothetical protein
VVSPAALRKEQCFTWCEVAGHHVSPRGQSACRGAWGGGLQRSQGCLQPGTDGCHDRSRVWGPSPAVMHPAAQSHCYQESDT